MCVKDWEQRMYLRLQGTILCLLIGDFVLLGGTNFNLHIKRIILQRKLTSVTIQMCKFFEQPLILVVTCPTQDMWCSWPGRNGSTWGTPPRWRAWTPRTPAPPNPTFSSPKKLFSPVSKSVPSRQENVTTYMLSHWPPLYCGAHLSLARSCQRGDYHQSKESVSQPGEASVTQRGSSQRLRIGAGSFGRSHCSSLATSTGWRKSNCSRSFCLVCDNGVIGLIV